MKLLSLAAAAAVAGAVLVLHAAPGHAATTSHQPKCAAVILAQETLTGHEADRPASVCRRHGRRLPPAGATCYVHPWGPYTPGAALQCDGRIYRHLIVG